MTGVPPHFLDGRDQRIAVRFVMALKQDGCVEHRLLQQAAACAQLISVDGFMLQAQSNVQDAEVACGVVLHTFCKGRAPRHNGNRHGRKLGGAGKK